MKKIILLMAMMLSSHVMADWRILIADDKGGLYFDKDSIRDDPSSIYGAILVWSKIRFMQTMYVNNNKNKPKYDEIYYLYNIRCDVKAYKVDEAIFKYKSKTVWQKTESEYNMPSSYSFAPPQSGEEKFIESVCDYRKIQKNAAAEVLKLLPTGDANLKSALKILNGSKGE